MANVEGSAKQQNKEKAWLWVKRHPNGVTRSELEPLTGIQRRTLDNYLNELEYEGKIYKDGTLWLPLDFEGTRLRAFDLTPEEAYTLYLATRLLVKQQDKRNDPAETALMKLAHILTSDAGVGEEIAQAAKELASRQSDIGFQAIFRTLVRGYIYRKAVRLTYRPLNGKSFDTTFHTYLIEPSAIGFSTYAIGHSNKPNELRSYKMERIQSAELTRDGYSIPNDFPGLAILRNAWSIISGDETVRVVLRFSPDVKERVLESQWHPSQDYSDDLEKPGWLRWWVDVAGTQDILPWIRGWGADVEVIEPDRLKEMLKREARKLAELYGVTQAERQFFAHFREKDKNHKEPQYLLDHLTEVSALAGKFAAKIGLQKAGEVLGLLHDIGKASQEFQNYILSGEGLIDPDSDDYVDAIAKKGKVDHSSAGAQVIYEKLWHQGIEGRITAQILALCLASHHSGLIDCISPDGKNAFQIRMYKEEQRTHKAEALFNLKAISEKLEILLSDGIEHSVTEKVRALQEDKESRETLAFKHGLFIRFLFSCLIDADRLNTADFEFPGNFRIRNYGKYTSWQVLIERLNQKIAEFENEATKNEVDMLRSQVSQACLDFSTKEKGIYQLTVPTGGGKTLASLRFALNHAGHHQMDRIIYVIPYTSIIDQNAEEVRKILEDRDASGNLLDNVVLEHHSNLTPEEETRRQNLLAQNWDAPIVFTTQVQFLETLFGSGTRGARRMHQLANSVIILDEVQTVPVNCIHMLNVALRFLAHSCGATIVLCTATQPPFDKIAAENRALFLPSDKRIIPNEPELFEKLKRVSVFDQRKIGGWDDEGIADLAERALDAKGSVLVIVNTKSYARSLFQNLYQRDIAGIFHLSTSMCPVHRLEVLDKVKAKLSNGDRVICISTQLIEAGVDIDFGSVIRYLAGMDSIDQESGRCNRHGKREGLGDVWIVNPKGENLQRLKDIEVGRQKTERLLDDYKRDPSVFDNDRIGLEAMAAYYADYFYERKDEMNYNVGQDSPTGVDDNLFNLLSTNTKSVQEYKRTNNNTEPNIIFKQSFQKAAKSFRVIDSVAQGIVVPFGDEGKTLVADICGSVGINERYRLLRRLQRYSVNLFPHEFRKLAEMGAIQEAQPGQGIFYLDERYYSNLFGWHNEAVTDMSLLTA